MTEMNFEITITATAEVHDKDGNLISSTPVESKKVVSKEELEALGVDPADL